LNIAIQTAGALRKVEIFARASEEYEHKPGLKSEERDKLRKIMSVLGKTAKKDAKDKYPRKAETAARIDLAAQLLVDLIRQSTLLDSAGKHWVLAELVRKHSREQGGAGEDAAGNDADD
jgi:hypothetical protein